MGRPICVLLLEMKETCFPCNCCQVFKQPSFQNAPLNATVNIVTKQPPASGGEDWRMTSMEPRHSARLTSQARGHRAVPALLACG